MPGNIWGKYFNKVSFWVDLIKEGRNPFFILEKQILKAVSELGRCAEIV